MWPTGTALVLLQNLLLTIHDNKCYFALVKEDSSHPWNLTDHKQEVENYMKSLIEKNRGSNIQPASLEDARKEFNDLLADFHCLDKYVYLMELDRE
nr:hypothetical protein BaRGS_029761 [Batillaria attramentaria]